MQHTKRIVTAFKGSTHSSNNLASDDINIPCYLIVYAENVIQLIFPCHSNSFPLNYHHSILFFSKKLRAFPIHHCLKFFLSCALPLTWGILKGSGQSNWLGEFYKPSAMIYSSRELSETWKACLSISNGGSHCYPISRVFRMKMCFITIIKSPFLKRSGKKMSGKKGFYLEFLARFLQNNSVCERVWLLYCKFFKGRNPFLPACILSSQWGLTSSKHFLDIWWTKYSKSTNTTTLLFLMIQTEIGLLALSRSCFGQWAHRNLKRWTWNLSAVSLSPIFAWIIFLCYYGNMWYQDAGISFIRYMKVGRKKRSWVMQFIRKSAPKVTSLAICKACACPIS